MRCPVETLSLLVVSDFGGVEGRWVYNVGR